METLWFLIVALMVAAYVVLDGFDLGAGVISSLRRARPDERHHHARHRPRLGRQRSLAPRRRRHSLTSHSRCSMPPLQRFLLPLMMCSGC